jgi:hypothetical protein
MQYRRLDQMRGHAAVAEARPSMTRRERLRRWADVLDREGYQVLDLLHEVEARTETERRRLRVDRSPISVAFGDPALRAEGLSGDTFGDARSFFGLSDEEAHRLLCDCDFTGVMSGHTAAWRVRVLTQGGVLGLLARAFLL